MNLQAEIEIQDVLGKYLPVFLAAQGLEIDDDTWAEQISGQLLRCKVKVSELLPAPAPKPTGTGKPRGKYNKRKDIILPVENEPPATREPLPPEVKNHLKNIGDFLGHMAPDPEKPSGAELKGNLGLEVVAPSHIPFRRHQ